MKAEEVKPYDSVKSKGEQVEKMFDNIAPHYDLMNTAMTFGLHRYWRDRALRDAIGLLHEQGVHTGGIDVLDVATGTGDVVFALHKRFPHAHICGIDLSDGMLKIARERRDRLPVSARRLISFNKGDVLSLPAASESYDLVKVAYGVRNFEDITEGYREMLRVLRPGGVICVIELSEPTHPMVKSLYNFYSRRLIPGIGSIVSGDRRAYTYLPESIAAMPQRDDMTELMELAGFRECSWRQLTFGTVCVYLAQK